MAYIYKHLRNDTNQIFYIGIGKQKNRVYSKLFRNKHWINIVNKVGYTFEIIEDGLSWSDACEKEKSLIKQYGRHDLGLGNLVNMTDGGEGGSGIKKIVSETTKIKMSKSAKARGANHTKPHSTDTKEKMSSSHKNMSDKTKQKMSNTRTGVKFSEETKQKMREAKLGRVVSDETKQKIRIGNIKTKNLKK